MQLEQERSELLRTVDDSRASALSKAGEIAIIRRNHERAIAEYEKRIVALQRSHADVTAKQRAEIESVQKAREKVETDNRFLAHDLAQETGKTSFAVRRGGRDSPKKSFNGLGSGANTPRRHSVLPFRDGFDEEDIARLSPSKSRDKSKISTPKGGAKRKRSAADQSPGNPALQLGEQQGTVVLDDGTNSDFYQTPVSLLVELETKIKRADFVRRLLERRSEPKGRRTFEAMAEYRIPTSPDRIAASYLHDHLVGREADESDQYAFSFCEAVSNLWGSFLDGQEYAPVHLLIDLIQYILADEPLAIAALLVEQLISKAVTTAELVAMPLARASMLPSTPTDSHKKQDTTHIQGVDASECLSLIHTLSMSCISSKPARHKFWDTMEAEFVLLMLMKVQPLDQIIQMLRILATAALEDSFGPRKEHADPARQSQHETALVDRLLNLLFEQPEPPKEAPRYAILDVLSMRTEVLKLMGAMCATQYGGRLLASHRHAIGRLIVFLNSQIDALYETSSRLRSMLVGCINITTRLLYHIIMKFPDEADVRMKLNAVHGGPQRHLVALSRLAFSEGLVLEAGIDEEVSEAAHRLLDEYLSPDEGEALLQVFSSGRSVA